MKLDEFNKFFEEYFSVPLFEQGFEYVGKSKTLTFSEKHSQLAIIRLGGKYSRVGHINQIICFRHSFLRTIEDNKRVSFSDNINDYPYKLTLAEFSRYFRLIPIYRNPRYNPINIGIRETELLRFDNCNSDQIKQKLELQANIMLDKVLPWAKQVNENKVAAQIRRYGEQAWCEVRWLEDYQSKIES